jgi:hypothetical protein
MKVNSKYFWLIICIVFLISCYSEITSKKLEAKIAELEAENNRLISVNDSLFTENFVNRQIISRYEIGIDMYKEQHPREALEILEIILNKTE